MTKEPKEGDVAVSPVQGRNSRGCSEPREGRARPGEDKTALERSQCTKPLSGGHPGAAISGDTPMAAPRDPMPPRISPTSPSQPPSSPAGTGTLIPTSSSAEAAFSCLLKINEADNDSAGAPGSDGFRSALGRGWRSENEKLRPRSAASARGSLFAVTLNFLLSIVSRTSDGKRGRNRDYLIALKIPNEPRAEVICPNPLLFGFAPPGRGCGRSHLSCTSPQRSQIFWHHLPTPRRWQDQQGPACGGKVQTPGAEASPALQGDFGALRHLLSHLHWGHSVAIPLLPSPCPTPGGPGEAEPWLEPECGWRGGRQGWGQGGHGRRGNAGGVGRAGRESKVGRAGWAG